MTISRWARRSTLITVALAVVLPFSTGTASADPIISILGDNNVQVTATVSGNLDSVPLGVGVAAAVSTGDGVDVEAVVGVDLDLGAEIGGSVAQVWLQPDGPWANDGPELTAASAEVAPEVVATPETEVVQAVESAPEVTEHVEAVTTQTATSGIGVGIGVGVDLGGHGPYCHHHHHGYVNLLGLVVIDLGGHD